MNHENKQKIRKTIYLDLDKDDKLRLGAFKSRKSQSKIINELLEGYI